MSSKTHHCKVCSEKDPTKFYLKRKNICIICLRKQEKERVSSKYNKESAKLYRYANTLGIRLKSARRRAEKLGLEFDLDLVFLEEIFKKQEYKCVYSGIKFQNSSPIFSVSIDRKDPKKGYTKNNIQLVCSIVNTMKLDLTENEFLDLIKEIYKNS